MNETWCQPGEEPTLEEVLADPIVHMVARRDGLSATDVQTAARNARLSLSRRHAKAFALWEDPASQEDDERYAALRVSVGGLG